MDRDRDDAGRPHNARPRDGLGRPLAYGANGVPRQPEGQVRTPEQTLHEAQRLFDAGRPFHAHEVFEDAWKAGRGTDEASLWKALAQLAVGCTPHGYAATRSAPSACSDARRPLRHPTPA